MLTYVIPYTAMSTTYDILPTCIPDGNCKNSESQRKVSSHLSADDELAHYHYPTTKQVSSRALALVYVLYALAILVVAMNLAMDMRLVRHQKIRIDTLPRPSIP